ncbi:rho GTPase-activating protein 15-like isoform X2 [Liolophura sinensis]|uniref:rho GTPase-activating protein 15-like isoform X2 n=1 Tax=Liolophura sinensis TaxID=3198878 RepID=UPI003158DA61
MYIPAQCIYFILWVLIRLECAVCWTFPLPTDMNIEKQGQNEYANLNTIQAVLKPPIAPNPDNFIRGLCDNWELYSDSISGRQFYYNSATKETTWKPPRGVDKLLADGEIEGSTEEKNAQVNGNAISSGRAVSPSRIPHGYKEETTEAGGKVYINEVTKDKWFAFVDNNGRQYFYKEGSQESEWHLPELVNHSQSVSNALSHVDVASCKAAIKGRMSKAKSMYVDSQDRQEAQRKSTTLPSNLILTAAKGITTSEMKDLVPSGSQTSVNPVFPRDLKDRFLNKTKVMENGKRLKKNWTSSYVLLSGSNLVFYKDQKASQVRAGSPHGKPDFIINLHGANVEFGGKDLSSKKNVILLTTARSSEDLTQYLLQSDDNSRIHHWYITLSDVVERIRQGVELPTDLNGSPGKKSPVNSEPNQLKRGKSTKGKPGGSGISRSVSTEETVSQERKRRIRDILFHFMTRRPSPEVLKEKGIIKDVVFGCDLKQLCEKEGASVPFFIKHVISCIEGQGLNHDGMYRVSGNASQIQKLRCMVDQDQTYNFHDPNVWDINVLTGALKLFFRELKEPLFPFDSYSRFVDAIQVPQSSAKLRAFKEAVNALPKCNYETIRLLFRHLKKVTEQSKENRMQSHNLAIVFGPTLLWPELRAPNMAVSLVFQNRIVEFILLEYDNLFR